MAGYTNLNSRLARLEAVSGVDDDGPMIVRCIIVGVNEKEPTRDEAIDALIARGELEESQRSRVSLIVQTIVRPLRREQLERGEPD